MALKGKYTYKGIDMANAYIKMKDVHWGSDWVLDNKIYKEIENTTWTAWVYKDTDQRTDNPNDYICIIHGAFSMDNNVQINPVIQAYTAMKSLDEYKKMKDA